MGKTPEKPHAAPRNALATGLRYRRKVPATSESSSAPDSASASSVAPVKLLKQPPRRPRERSNQDSDADPRASESNRRKGDESDNQLEHRSAEPAGAASVAVGPDPRPEPIKDAHAPARKKKKHKAVPESLEPPDAPSTSTSKKQSKPKGSRHPKAATVPATAPDDLEPPVTVPVLEPTATAADRVPKSKRSHGAKRPKRVALDASAGAPSEPVEPDLSSPHATAPALSPPVQTTTSSRTSNRKRTARASLLKTLLWKVKASPSPASLPLPRDATAPGALRPSATSNGSDDSDRDDEELAFATAERQARKRLALETATAKTLQRCSVASSSQETQSGSDDEVFSPFSLVPPADAAAPVLATSCFPTPLALDDIASALAHTPRAQVHEITLENFAFSPPEVAIVKGDVVVWRVSDDTPALVEHALVATLYDATGTTPVRKTATPLLRPGSAFGWRFDAPGRLDVVCSVYRAQCSVAISASVAAKRRAALAQSATSSAPVASEQRSKPASAQRRVKRAGSAAVPVPVASDSRAVLAHLQDVQAAAAAAFIVVGDVPCPLASADRTSEPTAADADRDDASDDDVADFAQRILAMLARSEAHLAQHRSSFDVLGSGFDARAACDFFKQRYAQAAADPSVAYARCPERPRATESALWM